MSNSTKVTWLLPVKNGMPYITETLASIKAQTYRNWVIIAWDNNSSDGTLEELNKWIPERIPGKIVCNNPLPLVECLDEMVKMADTEFCARIDADDINIPLRLEKQIEFLEAHPEVGAVGSNVTTIDINGEESGSFGLLNSHHDDILHMMLAFNPLAHPVVTFRRLAVLQAGNYNKTNALCAEDYDLWMRLAHFYKLANLEEKLLLYRVHAKSKTNQEKKDNVLTDNLNYLFCENAPTLYGISKTDALKLRELKYNPSILILWKISSHLSKIHGGSIISRMRSESFINSSRHLTSNGDYLSRIIIKFLSLVKLRIKQ